MTTLHGRLDLPELALVYRQFRSVPLVSISDAQREPLPWANWHATVYHGLPLNLFHLNPAPGKHLAFLGRVSPEKRVDRAIELAKRLEMPLRIAAKVDRADEDYFRAEIKPCSTIRWSNSSAKSASTRSRNFSEMPEHSLF